MRGPVLVRLMTGRSNPADGRPSAAQSALLDALEMPGATPVRANFPWPVDGVATPGPAGHAGPAAAMPVWRASLHNAAQTLGSRRAGWARRHRADAEDAFARPARTVVLCGSCGLELLANLGLSRATRARLHVFAWGPVVWRVPAVAELELVRGRRDRISRLGAPGARVDHVVEGGHMDYLEDPVVVALARRFVVRVRDAARA